MKDSEKIKRLLFIMLIVSFLSGSVAGCIEARELDPPINDLYWKNLGSMLKFSMDTSQNLEIFGYFYTNKVLRQFYGISWKGKQMEVLNTKWELRSRWPDRIPLRVIVRSHGGDLHFWAFSFVQKGKEYNVEGVSDVKGFDGSVLSKKMPAGSIKKGFLALPKAIKLTETFQIRYGRSNAEVMLAGQYLDEQYTK